MYRPDIAGIDLVDHRLPEHMDLQLITENFQDILILVDTKGRIKYMSPAYGNLTGIDPLDRIGDTFIDSKFFHPDDYDSVAVSVQKGLAEAKPDMVQFRYRHANGNYLWMEATSNPIFDETGKFLGTVCICRDISSRKNMERALVESEAKFKKQADYLNTLINNMNELFYTYDKDGRLIFANKKCAEVLGYDLALALGEKLTDFVPENGKAMVVDGINTTLSKGEFHRYEQMVVTQSGETRIISTSVSPIIENGAINGGVVVGEDITERRQTEKALQEQLDFMQKLMDSIPTPVYYKDSRGLYQGCNQAFLAACGLPLDKVISHSDCDVFPADMTEYHHQMDLALFKQGGVQEYETTLRYGDGQRHNVVISRATYNNMDGSLGGLVGVLIDITDRKQLEKKVLVLERLNIMGQLAAGIAHEIRNPMTTARGFLQMLGHNQELKNYREYFELIIEELDRANGIITEFLSMGKFKAVNLKTQSLNDVIRTLYPLILADALGSDKNILIKLADIPDLYMDDMDIRQLILNLVRNGLDAMGPGAIMNIVTYMDNGDVILSVQDQGQGIDPTVLEKLGTPFISTKEQGTGLGLAVCYSIAARHNASIEVETGAEGTNFKVRFKPIAYLNMNEKDILNTEGHQS
ncbi:MAG TPA: PAS domain S-box protein [Syntrophomonadaceae bacterium]|nr:PAS domain S-box protein [Syntrophomonadaceae bacterium]